MSTSHSVSAISNSDIHQDLDPSHLTYAWITFKPLLLGSWWISNSSMFILVVISSILQSALFVCSVWQHLDSGRSLSCTTSFWSRLILGSTANYSCNGFIIVWIGSSMYVVVTVHLIHHLFSWFSSQVDQSLHLLAFSLVSVSVLGSALMPFEYCDRCPCLTARACIEGLAERLEVFLIW